MEHKTSLPPLSQNTRGQYNGGTTLVTTFAGHIQNQQAPDILFQQIACYVRLERLIPSLPSSLLFHCQNRRSNL